MGLGISRRGDSVHRIHQEEAHSISAFPIGPSTGDPSWEVVEQCKAGGTLSAIASRPKRQAGATRAVLGRPDSRLRVEERRNQAGLRESTKPFKMLEQPLVAGRSARFWDCSEAWGNRRRPGHAATRAGAYVNVPTRRLALRALAGQKRARQLPDSRAIAPEGSGQSWRAGRLLACETRNGTSDWYMHVRWQ